MTTTLPSPDSLAATYPTPYLHIDGADIARDDRNASPVFDPANGRLLGMLPHASNADLDAALQAAQRAFQGWSRTPALEKSRVLRAAAAYLRENEVRIAQHLTLDQGKPLAEARIEVLASAEHLEWHAEECRRIYGRAIPARAAGVAQRVEKEPIGVVAAFTPWNFPMSQAARKVAAALGAGCTMILKGPENAPSAVLALSRALLRAGLPKGCLNLVWGEPAMVSGHLLDSPIVRGVSFTGSVPVGKWIAARAAANLQRVTLELGGHAPVIVFKDADIEKAARVMAMAKFRNAGQVCIAPSRFYVERPVYERFVERFATLAGEVAVGHGLDPRTRMGPLAHGRRVAAMQAFTQNAQENGGEILCGGRTSEGPGHFFLPTVVTGPSEDSNLMRDEPFGPIAPIVPWDNFEDVLRLSNRLPYGLAAYAFTTSASSAQRVAAGLRVGQVSINHTGLAIAELPMGGVNESGYGAEGGMETFEGYLNTKVVTEQH